MSVKACGRWRSLTTQPQLHGERPQRMLRQSVRRSARRRRPPPGPTTGLVGGGRRRGVSGRRARSSARTARNTRRCCSQAAAFHDRFVAALAAAGNAYAQAEAADRRARSGSPAGLRPARLLRSRNAGGGPGRRRHPGHDQQRHRDAGYGIYERRCQPLLDPFHRPSSEP